MKVLLVDDHPLVLNALRVVIEAIGSDTTVVGVDNPDDARAALRGDDGFDLVMLDLTLGDADGFDVLVDLRTQWPAVPVVVVSATERTGDVVRAIDSGAMGFVPKRSSQEELHEALAMVMMGAMYVPPSMLGLAFAKPLRSGGAAAAPPPALAAAPVAAERDTVPGVMRIGGGLAEGSAAVGGAPVPAPDAPHKLPSPAEIGLTPRQAEVLSLLLQGLPNKLIARQLSLSVETVKDHVAAVLRALNVSTRTQAVLAVSRMTMTEGGAFRRRLPQPGDKP